MNIKHSTTHDPNTGEISVLSELCISAAIKRHGKDQDVSDQLMIRRNLEKIYTILYGDIRVPLAYLEGDLRAISADLELEHPDIANNIRRCIHHIHMLASITRPLP
jgi:hypothetical protein